MQVRTCRAGIATQQAAAGREQQAPHSSGHKQHCTVRPLMNAARSPPHTPVAARTCNAATTRTRAAHSHPCPGTAVPPSTQHTFRVAHAHLSYAPPRVWLPPSGGSAHPGKPQPPTACRRTGTHVGCGAQQSPSSGPSAVAPQRARPPRHSSGEGAHMHTHGRLTPEGPC